MHLENNESGVKFTFQRHTYKNMLQINNWFFFSSKLNCCQNIFFIFSLFFLELSSTGTQHGAKRNPHFHWSSFTYSHRRPKSTSDLGEFLSDCSVNFKVKQTDLKLMSFILILWFLNVARWKGLWMPDTFAYPTYSSCSNTKEWKSLGMRITFSEYNK